MQSICKIHDLDFSLMQKWYDGYVFNKLHIYNPESVQMVLLTRKFRSYWTETETYFSLKKYIKMNFDGLRDCVALLVNRGNCKINTRNFQNDMTNINSKDDVLTLLVHLGYLAFNEDMQDVYIPNEEILEEFKNVLDDKDADTAIEQIKAKKYPKALESRDGRIILVGINYDKASKKHECKIEEWVKEVKKLYSEA